MQHKNRAKNTDFDEDDSIGLPFMLPEKKPYRAFQSEYRQRQLSYYLSGPIVGPEAYVEMIHAIRTASTGDQIYIYLNTSGGRLDTGIQLLNAIRESDATVYTVLEAQAYSLGALLFLCGNAIMVGDHALLMFHNYTSGLYGKGNEQMAEVVMTSKWIAQVMNDICVPFLSPEEVQDVLNGKDIWMGTEEIRERLSRIEKSRTKDGQKISAAGKPEGTLIPAGERADDESSISA